MRRSRYPQTVFSPFRNGSIKNVTLINGSRKCSNHIRKSFENNSNDRPLKTSSILNSHNFRFIYLLNNFLKIILNQVGFHKHDHVKDEEFYNKQCWINPWGKPWGLTNDGMVMKMGLCCATDSWL